MALSLYMQHASEARLAQLSRHPQALMQAAGTAVPVRARGGAARGDVLDLRQSWHVLHGLFTGTAWEGAAPANTLMAGGREIGAALGCGRPRLVDAAETRAFAGYVAPLCPFQLKARVDRRRVARTRFYAAECGTCPDLDDLREIVVRDLPALKAYLGRASGNGHGLLMWMM